MSYYADESDAYTEYGHGERDERAYGLATDYMAAREAVRRIHHSMSREEVWAIKDRFYRAELALTGKRESDAYRETNDRVVREIRQGAA